MIPQETKTQKNPPAWHSQELGLVLKTLNTNPNRGLTSEEATKRQQAFGKNVLPKGKKTTALEMFLRQFASPLVYILLIAAILTWWIKEYADMTVILVVVAVNALIGFFQEYRASKIFEKLKSLVRVEALVIRDGKLKTIDSEELVQGDIIVLKGGNKVPADARLVSAAELEANEALLTGESKPTHKFPGIVAAKAAVGDRSNMVFMGTVLEAGEGGAVVVATGARTEIGQISALAQSTEEDPSPLQARMAKLATFLTEVFVVISAAIFLLGILEGDPWVEMFKTTIAVAVAAIPEGLPAAISIILAVSSKKILERKGLVRKLIAAETLGSTSVICADKTGTLTYGQMKVEEIITPSQSPPIPLRGTGGEKGTGISPSRSRREGGEREGVDQALLAMALANEAVIEDKEGKPSVKGEATDKAKLQKFLDAGKNLEEVLAKLPRLGLLPFDSERKYLASFHQSAKGMKIFVSGAPEIVVEKSTLPLSQKKEILKTFEDLAKRGFRVIGLAQKTINNSSYPPLTLRGGTNTPSLRVREGGGELRTDNLTKYIKDLTYLGLAAIRDPIREDVRETLKITRHAGIKVIMITGDHLLTAKAIGLELGFGTAQEAVLSGEDLEKLSDKELNKRLPQIEIISRAAPIHKMRIIDAWQKRGAVVAMTGDGVNDAPALKSANIGLAVGSGTDVSREASDLVLLDDSFSTITAAVQEGRTGFANIRKATVVVMSNAFTEIILITSSLVLGTPFPITAVQILWVNLVEDGLPVLSLAFEPSEKGVMEQKPLSLKEPILNREAKSIIFAVGILSDLLLVGIFLYLLKILHWELIKAQSFVFVAAATPTLLNVFAFKSLRIPIHRINLLNNRFLLGAVALGFILMIAAIYTPLLNHFLKTVPLPFGAALAALLLFPLQKLALVELTKWWYNKNTKN